MTVATNNYSPSQCFIVLEMSGTVDEEGVQRAFKRLAKSAHPDAGGSHARMVALTRARNDALEILRLHRERIAAEEAAGAPSTPKPDVAPTPGPGSGASSAPADAAADAGEPCYDEAFIDDETPCSERDFSRAVRHQRRLVPIGHRLAWHLLRNLWTLVGCLVVGTLGMQWSGGNSLWLRYLGYKLPDGWLDVYAPWWNNATTTVVMTAGMVLVAAALALIGPLRTREAKAMRVVLAVPVMALVTWNLWFATFVAIWIFLALKFGDV